MIIAIEGIKYILTLEKHHEARRFLENWGKEIQENKENPESGNHLISRLINREIMVLVLKFIICAFFPFWMR